MSDCLNPRAFRFPCSVSSVLFVAGILAHLLLCPSPGQAQDLRWGFSASVTSGGFQGDASAFARQGMLGTELPAEFDGRRTGFSLGVSLRSRIKSWMTLRTALRYEQQGGIVERELLGPADGPAYDTAEFQFDYLTMPLLLEVRSPQPVALNLRASLYVGPALELNLRSRANRNYRTARGERNLTDDVETPVVVGSATTGVEVAYPLSNGGDLALDLRYGVGLSEVVSEWRGDEASTRRSTVQIGFRYVMP